MMIEVIKWAVVVSATAAMASVIGAFITIKIIEKRGEKIFKTFKTSFMKDPEVQKWIWRFDTILEKVEKLLKKVR